MTAADGRAVTDALLLARAVDLACRAHADQHRKGHPGEPYFSHVADVARRIAEATQGADAALVAAALLHDTVEDGGATVGDIERGFGADIAALVAEVTDDPALDEPARKARQVETAPHASDRAKLLKLADKASNLDALATSPHPDARRDRAYADWAERVAAGLRGTSPELEAQVDAALAALRGRHG